MEPANQILQQRVQGYRKAMPIMKAVNAKVQDIRNESSFAELKKETQQVLNSFDYQPEVRPGRRRRRSTLLGDSVVMSTLGETDSEDDETNMLKRISFEIIDSVSYFRIDTMI